MPQFWLTLFSSALWYSSISTCTLRHAPLSLVVPLVMQQTSSISYIKTTLTGYKLGAFVGGGLGFGVGLFVFKGQLI